MSGGGQSSETNPTIPRELQGLYSGITRILSGIDGMGGLYGDMPVTNYMDIDQQQFAGLSPLEILARQQAAGLAGAGPSAAGQSAFNIASGLAGYGGPDFSGISQIAPLSFGGVTAGGGQMPGSGWQPGQSGGAWPSWAETGPQVPNSSYTQSPSAQTYTKDMLNPRDGEFNRGGVAGVDPSDPSTWPPGVGGPGSGGITLEPGDKGPADPGVDGSGSAQTGLPPAGQQPTGPTYNTYEAGIGRPSDYGSPASPSGIGSGGPSSSSQPGSYAMPGQYKAGGASDYGIMTGNQSDLLDRIDNPLESIDFANHPALKSALDTFMQTTLPGIANSAGAMGLGRSGAALKAVNTGQAQMALPVMQQLIAGELQNKGYDVSQRGQDIGQLMQGSQLGLGMRGQDIDSGVGQRGQDINALLTGRGQDIGIRGQDIDALLGGSAQGLAAQQAAMAGMTGLDAQQFGQQTGIMDILSRLGSGERSIEDARLGANRDESLRQYEMAMEALLAPMGGLTGMIGSRTRTSGGK